jgi:hypothetical protein
LRKRERERRRERERKGEILTLPFEEQKYRVSGPVH